MKIIIAALLLVIWWIGIWGLVETIIHQYIRGSFVKAICVYSSLILVVLFSVWINPDMVESLI